MMNANRVKGSFELLLPTPPPRNGIFDPHAVEAGEPDDPLDIGPFCVNGIVV